MCGHVLVGYNLRKFVLDYHMGELSIPLSQDDPNYEKAKLSVASMLI